MKISLQATTVQELYQELHKDSQQQIGVLSIRSYEPIKTHLVDLKLQSM